jgi:hypothetical protein
MAHAQRQHPLHVFRASLGQRVEDRIAAADVGEDGVAAAVEVAEFDAVGFAGAAAVLEGGAGGEEAAEDAVFGVEDGEVLVGDGFEGGAAECEGELGDLIGVEVVGGGDAEEAELEE